MGAQNRIVSSATMGKYTRDTDSAYRKGRYMWFTRDWRSTMILLFRATGSSAAPPMASWRHAKKMRLMRCTKSSTPRPEKSEPTTTESTSARTKWLCRNWMSRTVFTTSR